MVFQNVLKFRYSSSNIQTYQKVSKMFQNSDLLGFTKISRSSNIIQDLKDFYWDSKMLISRVFVQAIFKAHCFDPTGIQFYFWHPPFPTSSTSTVRIRRHPSFPTKIKMLMSKSLRCIRIILTKNDSVVSYMFGGLFDQMKGPKF